MTPIFSKTQYNRGRIFVHVITHVFNVAAVTLTHFWPNELGRAVWWYHRGMIHWLTKFSERTGDPELVSSVHTTVTAVTLPAHWNSTNKKHRTWPLTRLSKQEVPVGGQGYVNRSEWPPWPLDAVDWLSICDRAQFDLMQQNLKLCFLIG
jgi:hypothetical protein